MDELDKQLKNVNNNNNIFVYGQLFISVVTIIRYRNDFSFYGLRTKRERFSCFTVRTNYFRRQPWLDFYRYVKKKKPKTNQ